MTLASQHPVVSTVTWTSPSLLSAVAYQITAPWDAQHHTGLLQGLTLGSAMLGSPAASLRHTLASFKD